MHRRKAVKAIAISTVTPQMLLAGRKKTEIPESFYFPAQTAAFESPWHEWPDMLWTGPEFWGNRLQDWQIRDGKATCVVSAPNRNLHCLTCQLSNEAGAFETSISIDLLNREVSKSSENYVGFRLGAKGPFDDYRSAAVFGQGIDAGVTSEGRLFIGEKSNPEPLKIGRSIRLRLQATPAENGYQVQLTGFDPANDQQLAKFAVDNISSDDLTGNIALVAHFGHAEEIEEKPSVSFAGWMIKGAKIQKDLSQVFGPICFAQYTLHNKALKLNAQLTPIEAIADHTVELQIKERGKWKTLKESPIDPLGRIAQFRVENWEHKSDIPYRVRLQLPLSNDTKEYFYEGTIAGEPKQSDQVKVAVFSCNADYGFPDSEIAPQVVKHHPHMAVFLGDQFYESTGGFGIQTSPIEKSSLDYLRKWYMFGWSYRDIFRHIPAAIIPDDHDVYHGNVWGEAGKEAPTDQGWGYDAQDQGGYKMPPEWVNMVQRTQTGHLPDPYDPTPVKQDIGVYYTDWNYGGISFAILEDRKFKSAPKNVLPEEAKVVNGFIQNPEFNIKKHYDVEADLLGERQMKFLNDWAGNWGDGVQMKAVLSQTNFCTLATLPEGSIIDQIVPKLPIPEPGEYVKGDAPTTDMDSNGWPQKGRDEALRTIRKCFAFHIAGDQHLASMVHYGVDEFGDAGYAFAGPALNNLWPRRWWPSVTQDHQPLAGEPKYTGNFLDGFGNRMTVHAVANPHQTGIEPALIYDRATGYGIVTFDKNERTIQTECWPRYVDPNNPSTGNQYTGWPIIVYQQDNYDRKAAGYLPELQIEGVENPVVQVINEQNREVEYTLRIKGNSFRPKVFAQGNYTVKVSELESGKEQSVTGLQPTADSKESKVVVL